MSGIVSYGAYIPRYKIETTEIASVWGQDGSAMARNLNVYSKSVPGPDEDVITIAVECARTAMKRCGVTDLIAISAIGSLREEMAPTHFVGVDQFIDRTSGRASSFFGEGLVAHVSLADPVCPRLAALVANAAESSGSTVHRGGTYIAMEGPQFSTRAESRMYRGWGGDVIGMTGMPEARLAREAELPYALIGMVTDYDSWRDEEAGVEAFDILAVLKGNADRARAMLDELVATLPDTRAPSPVSHSRSW